MKVSADPIRTLFDQAQTLQKCGQYEQAEKLYLEILAQRPGHVDAIAFLGVIAMQTKRLDDAERLLTQAIRSVPQCSSFHCNLGLLYRETNRLEEAICAFEESIRLQPDNAVALNNLGVTQLDLGKPEAAAQTLQLARGLHSDDPNVYVNLGKSLLAQKRDDLAIKQFRKAIELKPESADAFNGIGTAQRSIGDWDEAVESFKQAIQLQPNLIAAHSNLGATLTTMKRYEDAEQVLHGAIAIDESNAVCLNNLGIAIMEQGRIEESESWFLRALQVQSDYASARSNLGAIYLMLGRVDESLQTLEDALRIQPDIVDARWNRSLALLSKGDFQQGWLEYEWRWRKFSQRSRKFPRPRWDGTSLAGKTILLHAEQGLGDTLQFIRYARELKRQGGRVILTCQDPLVPLLKLSPDCDVVVTRQPKMPAFDVHAPLLSLPTIMRTTLETIPSEVPYLKADDERIRHWKDRLSNINRLRIAIAWQGSPTYAGDKHRSIPFCHFANLAKKLPGVQFISLQKQHVDAATSAQMGQLGILLFPDMDETHGAFMDTAAIIMNVDLVITSDTSIPHLAGALGVPVWLALSAVPDWRWFLEGKHSPWYPTMRTFRARERGCWEDVFEQIAGRLSRDGKALALSARHSTSGFVK